MNTNITPLKFLKKPYTAKVEFVNSKLLPEPPSKILEGGTFGAPSF